MMYLILGLEVLVQWAVKLLHNSSIGWALLCYFGGGGYTVCPILPWQRVAAQFVLGLSAFRASPIDPHIR